MELVDEGGHSLRPPSSVREANRAMCKKHGFKNCSFCNKRRNRLRILRIRRGCKKRNADPVYIENLTKANQKEGRSKRHREASRKNAEEQAKDPVLMEKRTKAIRRTMATPEYKKAQSIRSKSYWENRSDEENAELAEKVWKMSRRRMNGLESKAKSLVKGSYLRFVGNNKLWISGHCPDFAIQCRKKIVEVFGDYWHNLEKSKTKDAKRLKDFSDAGWDVLIVWEHEILKSPQTVRNKVLRFVTK